MNKFQISQKSKNENEIEPFTFSKNYSIKLNQLSNTNKESATDEKNLNNNISNEHINRKQKINESPYFHNEEIPKHENNPTEIKNNSNENNNNENDMMGSYNYEQQDEDFYYFISENIPPQNFTQKLRDIKIKYEKLNKEIEMLKIENKKYNPNFNNRKNKGKNY